MRFSTLNESSLHNTLKTMYSEIYDGKTEVEADGHIYDIVTKNGNVIEIQTKNLSKLLSKVTDAISKGRSVKIVHPNVIGTRIALHGTDGKLISSRKSPRKGCLYDIFNELTGMYSVLLDKHFSLEIIQVNITEKRIRTAEPEQSKNGRRRFKKNFQKADKELSEILGTIRLNDAKDWLALLPATLPEEFCAKDLGSTLGYKNPHIIIWVMVRMGLLEQTCTKSKSRYYKISGK